MLAILCAPAAAHTITYGQARPAAQREADRFAQARTEIKSMVRTTPLRHAYSARAEWTRVDPDGCVGCGFDPTTGQNFDTPAREACWVTVIVRFRTARSHRLSATVDEFFCA